MTTRRDNVNAYPLSWPAGWPRTATQRESAFKTTFATARDELMREIAMLGGRYVVLSSNVPLRNDGLPRSDARRPADTGVAVYFERRGRSMTFACDRWHKVEDNMRAISRTIEALRGIDRWGASEMMERAVQAFESLPPPKSCWDILGIRPDASLEQITAAYRAKAHAAHPDKGGSTNAMAEINQAYAEAKAIRGGT